MIRNWILCGYWNLVLDQHLDTFNYQKHNNPNSSKILRYFVRKYDSIDVCRASNPIKKNSHGLDLVQQRQQDKITF